MTNLKVLFEKLKRPKLLIRAAKIGSNDYKRTRDLKRLMRASRLPTPYRAMETLMALEHQLESIRKTGDGSYSIVRHVDVLTALMAEYQLLTSQRPQANSS